MSSPIRGIIFDIGGVVITSPLVAIAAYERERGFPKDWINVLITAYGEDGAWQKFERGELGLATFYGKFGEELSDVEKGRKSYAEYCVKRGLGFPQLPPDANMRINGRDLFGRMMRGSKFDDVVVKAIHRIRATDRFKVIAVTNNFGHSVVGIENGELEFLGLDQRGVSISPELKEMFHDYIDSSAVGLRKPDPAIYILACERNGLRPDEVVMLDDLRMNLKTARTLGMKTIQVKIGHSEEAIRELGTMLELELLENEERPFKL